MQPRAAANQRQAGLTANGRCSRRPGSGICREAVELTLHTPAIGTLGCRLRVLRGVPGKAEFCFVLFFITVRGEVGPRVTGRAEAEAEAAVHRPVWGCSFCEPRAPFFFYPGSSPGGVAKLYIHSSDRRQENSPLD